MKPSPSPLPVMRARKDEIDSFIAMVCSLSKFTEAQVTMNKRLHSIPGGWRDMRMICSVLSKLIDNIKGTFPQDRSETLDRLLPDVRFAYWYKGQIGRHEAISGIRTSDLDLLASCAHEGACKLCIDGQCDRCDLGKCFDMVLEVDRERGESYAYMDVGNGYDIRNLKTEG